MTEIWMWGPIASLILLAIGLALKSAQDAFALKQSEKDVARLTSEIESLKKSHDETISRIQESNSAEIEKLTNHIHQFDSFKNNAINPQGIPYRSASPQRKP